MQNNQQGASYVDPPIPSTIPPLSNPSPDVSRQLLEKYFNHFHPYFPIINRGQLFKMMSSSNVEDQPSPLLLYAIYAIGAMYPPTLQDSYNSLTFYDHARSKFFLTIVMGNFKTIMGDFKTVIGDFKTTLEDSKNHLGDF
jgi:hypothetical protein